VLFGNSPGSKRVRSHGERRCSILGPNQSRISPSSIFHAKIIQHGSLAGALAEGEKCSSLKLIRMSPGWVGQKKTARASPEPALNPTPHTLNPPPYTLHPQPSTLNLCSLAGALVAGAVALTFLTK